MVRNEKLGITIFFVVAFGFPWFGWIALENYNLPYWFLPLFCSLAGFTAAFAEGGITGLREFCKRTLHWRGPYIYMGLALLIPLVLGFLYLLTTGVAFSAMQPAFKAGFASMLLMAFITGPLAEEFGWRGYLQNKLLHHMNPICAAIIIGIIWCAWHIPLFYSSVFSTPQSALGFLVFTTTWSIFLVYLVQHAKGSVWPAILLHWMVNTHASILGALFPTVDGSKLPGGSNSMIFYLIAACILVLFNWHFFLKARKPAKD
jgi:uncharacterized protein